MRSSSFKKARAFIAARGGDGSRRRSGDRGPFAVGHLTVETRDVDPATGTKGEWKPHELGNNLVVLQAESLQAQAMIGAPNSPLNYIELGNPNPALPPALSDTTLQQSTAQRMPCSLTAVGNVVTAESVWTTADGNGFTYTEAGIFTGPFAAGFMYARKTFAGITKTNLFELRFTWHITYLIQTSGGECTGVSLVGPSTATAFTYASAAGGENSVAATFDFTVGANNVDVYMNGQRLAPGIQYNEVASAGLTAPTLGNNLNKGINLIGFQPVLGSKFLLVHRSQG